ncbi:hypothetical protein ACFQMA_16505 [Halosimplex aquaticum]|uniref:Uncharacterized protein n=1 Tax=Halosimplex aquaticum TaxID=3026162 RepID=A0ABD5Y2D4_9EURY|nr:hypothetical protein [Halosimplex aquaticum]
MGTATASTEAVDRIIEDWPSKTPGQQQHPKETAEKMRAKYGEPDEATAERLVWHDNGPWKRTEVYREGTKHRFPIPHIDHLYQYVDYQVPTEKYDDLARFDGSVHAHRTEGELVATCHKEEANVLAINLAHDVITERKAVEEAREAYATINAKLMAGGSPPATQGFLFSLPEGDQRDPDVTVVTDRLGRNRGKLALVALAAIGVLLAAARRRRRGGDRSTGDRAARPSRTGSRSGGSARTRPKR